MPDRREPPAMDLERNVGGIDRVARAAFGAVLLVAGGATFGSGSVVVGVLLLAAAAALLFNAVTGFCGVNALLGIDTCGVDAGDPQ